MRKRVAAILTVWIVTLAWWSRYLRTYLGSPVPGTYGVNVDWTRYSIVKTGRILEGYSANTAISSYAGAQSYDYGSILMAQLNIIAGTLNLVDSLTMLNAISPFGIIILPVIFVHWMHQAGGKQTSARQYLIATVLVFFASVGMVIKTSEAWFTEIVATATLLFVMSFTHRAINERRFLILFLIMSLFMMNLWHTWVFLFFVIIGATLVISAIISDQILDWQYFFSKRALGMLVMIFLIFFVTGTNLNHRFLELVENSSRIVLGSGDDFYQAQGSSLIQTSASNALSNLNLRRTAKIINFSGAILIVVVYFASRLTYAFSSDCDTFKNKLDLILFSSLLSFPLIVLVFYGIGGAATAVGRTAYVGIYFSIFCALFLLQSPKDTVRRISVVLVGCLVFSTLIAMPLSGAFDPSHSIEEEKAITFTGKQVSSGEYVFSDASLGPPLEYYNHKGIAVVQVSHENWEERMRNIYYRHNPQKSVQSIAATVESSRINQGTEPTTVYVLMSSDVENEGVGTLSFVTQPTETDPAQTLDRHRKSNKIYASGTVKLFETAI